MEGNVEGPDIEEVASAASSAKFIKTSGRVRKKSAKVLEMEEAERLEKKMTKKEGPRQAQTGKRPRTKSELIPDPSVAQQPTSPIPAVLGQPAVATDGTLKLQLNKAGLAAQGHEQDSPAEEKLPQLGSLISKLKMNLGNPAHSDSGENRDVAKKIKKTKLKVEGKEGHTVKSSLSPAEQQTGVAAKGKKRKALEEEGASPKQKLSKSAKRKKAEGSLSEAAPASIGAAPELLGTLGVSDQGPSALVDEEKMGVSGLQKKKKVSPSKTKKRLKGAGGEAKMAQFNFAILKTALQTVASGHTGTLPASPQGTVPQYANTDVMAMRLKTSKEKKASKTMKGKKAAGKDADKDKKKRSPTAYMLWCSSYRNKVRAKNPGIDFVQISKRLGEIWQALPKKEKLDWKCRAKREAAKALLSSGKPGTSAIKSGAAASAKNTNLRRHGGTAVGLAKAEQYTATSTSTPSVSVAPKDTYMSHKPTTCNPVDVAAHLKLLGESLSIIGARLQEHRGQIAVQGSLSVLLDSLVCALGPLTCLTSQVPELNACSSELHNQILDNIAFIMPGIG